MDTKQKLRNEILRNLEKNSRIDLGELAVLMGMEEAEIANEVAEMEKEKIICGYHTMINWDKTGVEKVTALIEVRVTPQRNQGFDRIAERIYNYPEVIFLLHWKEKHCRKYHCLYQRSFLRLNRLLEQRLILF